MRAVIARFAASGIARITLIGFNLEMTRPLIVDPEVCQQIQQETVAIVLIIPSAFFILIVVTVPLRSDEAVEFDALLFLLDIRNIFGIFIDLLFERGNFSGIFILQAFQHGLRADISAAAVLKCSVDDCRHFITRHGTSALECVIAHALDNALFGEIIERLIAPMILWNIDERVRTVGGESGTGNTDHRAENNRRNLLLTQHFLNTSRSSY